MPELVTIPISFLEITIDYECPEFKLWVDRAAIVQELFAALKPWDVTVDDFEPRTTGKLSEQGVNIKLPLKRVSFFFGPAYCKFTRDDVNWESAVETITILDVIASILVTVGGIVLGTKKTIIGLHLQPRTKPFVELLNPFLAPQLATLETEPIRTMAAIAKWPKRKVTIDGSAALANGLFLKLERDFESATTYEQMAQQLRDDEEKLFTMLGVEEDRG
jgi:hypothetical protein